MAEAAGQDVRSVASRWLPWIGGYAVLLAAAAWMIHGLQGAINDDAFIFLRYARNFVSGDGWTYFPGTDNRNGSTSPLWTLTLGLAAATPIDLEAASTAISAACLAGAALLTFATLRSVATVSGAVCAAALVVLNPELAMDRGMESALFVLLLSAVLFSCCVLKRPVVTGVLCGLLILARPDGALLVVAIGLVEWRRSRRPPWSFALACIGVLALWAAFATVAIGTPIPGTLAAKIAQGRSEYFGSYGGKLTFLRSAVDRVRHSPGLLVLLGLGVVGVVLTARRHPRARLYLVLSIGYAVGLFLTYALIIRPPDYPWYLASEHFSLAVAAGLGISELIASLPLHRLQRRPRLAAISALTVVAVVIATTLLLRGQPSGYPYAGYDLLSTWLDQETDAGDRVAISEIGVVGWRSNREVVDYLGLLTDVSVADVERDDYRSWLDREQPDYFVSHIPAFAMEAETMDVEWFPKAYRPVAEITDVASPSRVRVFERILDREAASASDTMVLVTPFLESAFEARDLALSDVDRSATNEALDRFLSDPQLQQRAQTTDGVDFGRLLAEVAQRPDATPDLIRVWDDLRDRIDAAGGFTSPLAPEVSAATLRST